jgi:hypothetical protein
MLGQSQQLQAMTSSPKSIPLWQMFETKRVGREGPRERCEVRGAFVGASSPRPLLPDDLNDRLLYTSPHIYNEEIFSLFVQFLSHQIP